MGQRPRRGATNPPASITQPLPIGQKTILGIARPGIAPLNPGRRRLRPQRRCPDRSHPTATTFQTPPIPGRAPGLCSARPTNRCPSVASR